MATESTTNTTTIIARADQHDIDLHKASDRVNFGSIKEPIDVPYLLGVQTDSFDWLIGNERWKARVEEDEKNGTNTVAHTSGLDEVFNEISPIENFAQTMSLTFSDPYFEEPRHTVQECKEKDYTYSAPLYVNAEFENGDTGEIKSQTVFMGDFPLQTPHGTFIIGGTERVIVSQLVRSPGVYFDRQQDRTSDKEVFGAKIIPSRGAWLEFEVDKKDQPQVRVDRKRKQSAIVFLMAIGMTKSEIAKAFKDYPLVLDALEKETLETQDEALVDLYRKIRPADTPTPRPARTCWTPSTSTPSVTIWPASAVTRSTASWALRPTSTIVPSTRRTSSPPSSTWWPCTMVLRPSRASATAKMLTCAWTLTISTTSATVVSVRSVSWSRTSCVPVCPVWSAWYASV